MVGRQEPTTCQARGLPHVPKQGFCAHVPGQATSGRAPRTCPHGPEHPQPLRVPAAGPHCPPVSSDPHEQGTLAASLSVKGSRTWKP